MNRLRHRFGSKPAVLLVGVLLVLFCFAGYHFETVGFVIEPKSRLFISGTSNVNSFDCEYRDQFKQSQVRVGVDGTSQTLLFDDLLLLVPAKGLDCDNSKMNNDLCEALQAGRYPYIKVKIHSATLSAGTVWQQGTTAMASASATITITNTSRNVSLPVRVTRLDNNRYWFVCRKQLRMTDFGVEPPSVMMGLIRVRDNITINFDMYAQVL